MKNWINSIKYWINSIKYKWGFLKVLNSPFRGLKLVWYWGDIAIGHPYFLPRKWVKYTEEDAIKLSTEDITNPKCVDYGKSVEEVVHHYRNYQKAVQIKNFGFDCNYLGWKTKFDEYRFEWSPSFSLILFGKQLNVTILPNIKDLDRLVIDCYWEAWLNWEYRTDKDLLFENRMEQLFRRYPAIWTSHGKDTVTTTNYYEQILKPKHLNLL